MRRVGTPQHNLVALHAHDVAPLIRWVSDRRDWYTLHAEKASGPRKHRARGGTRTNFQPLQNAGNPRKQEESSHVDRYTTRSKGKSTLIAHTACSARFQATPSECRALFLRGTAVLCWAKRTFGQRCQPLPAAAGPQCRAAEHDFSARWGTGCLR